MTIVRFRKIVDLALILSLMVVMLGAYTRLTDAGLGCPDWPGCYGHLIVQNQAQDQILSMTQIQYGIQPVEPRKAWTEMIHRYAAGTLALLIFFIALQALRQHRLWGEGKKAGMLREEKSSAVNIPKLLPIGLMGLVIFQALLGMWTVTLKLLPIVVMAHLLGGILIFSCLACFRLKLCSDCSANLAKWRFAIGLAVFIVFAQIALGGWVSANYAGISCVGFPQCNGQWLPTLHFAEGFNLFAPVGQNYQGGLLENTVRVTIQTIHRIGALITIIYLIGLCSLLFKKIDNVWVRCFAFSIFLLVVTQFCLGIINVLFQLPLAVAVAHNGVAALLMASTLMLFCLAEGKTSYE